MYNVFMFIKVQDNLRKEQQYRSEDQKGHGEMLKELQALIAKERDSQESCKAKVSEVGEGNWIRDSYWSTRL